MSTERGEVVEVGEDSVAYGLPASARIAALHWVRIIRLLRRMSMAEVEPSGRMVSRSGSTFVARAPFTYHPLSKHIIISAVSEC